jgi:hypothetical protein
VLSFRNFQFDTTQKRLGARTCSKPLSSKCRNSF